MPVSVRLEPLLEKELELAAKRQGVTKSQFIISALEMALGRKDSYQLLLQAQSELVTENIGACMAEENASPYKTAIRNKIRAQHKADLKDWLAFQEAKKRGEPWSANDAGVSAS
jgi:RHH-type rel operon transcriptional repressor/antitoxin RelB